MFGRQRQTGRFLCLLAGAFSSRAVAAVGDFRWIFGECQQNICWPLLGQQHEIDDPLAHNIATHQCLKLEM
jgi:hypothetical protein